MIRLLAAVLSLGLLLTPAAASAQRRTVHVIVVCEVFKPHFCATSADKDRLPVEENYNKFGVGLEWQEKTNVKHFRGYPVGVMRWYKRKAMCIGADTTRALVPIINNRCSGVKGILWAREPAGEVEIRGAKHLVYRYINRATTEADSKHRNQCLSGQGKHRYQLLAETCGSPAWLQRWVSVPRLNSAP